MMVRAVVAPSSIHGLGLFAADRVPAGATVWRFHPMIDRTFDYRRALRELPTAAVAFLERYGHVDHERGPVLCTDDARFMNHEDKPSLVEGPAGVDLAARDLAAGDELTCDYRLFGFGLCRTFLDGPGSMRRALG